MRPQGAPRITRSTVYRVGKCTRKRPPKRCGRPSSLTPSQISKLVSCVRKAVKNNDFEVTREWLKAKCNLSCSLSTISRVLATKGYSWRPVVRKIALSKADKNARYMWASKYRSKSASWWLSHIVAFLDEKRWVAPLSVHAKSCLGASKIRGVYRKSWEGTKFSKPSSKKHSPGGTAWFSCCGAFGRRGAVVWKAPHSSTSAQFCEALLPVLQYPVRSRRILMDNHASQTSSSTRKFMQVNKIKPIFLAPRSPDLMPLDFAGWELVESRLRVSRHQETRGEFMSRLRSAAQSITRSDVLKLLKGFVRRIREVYRNRGGHLDE